jgi:hypothetical protein
LDLELQINAAVQMAAEQTAEEHAGKVPGHPDEKQRAAHIRGTPDNKEKQRSACQYQDGLGKEGGKQMEAGGGGAAKEGCKKGDNKRDELPPPHCAPSSAFEYTANRNGETRAL